MNKEIAPSNSVHEWAQWYVSKGISVIPVKADGSKSPLYSGWRKYKDEIADEKTLHDWFGGKQIVGIGAVPGPASGHMIVLDFEHRGESAYMEWLKRLPSDFRALAMTLPTVTTPSGGKHIWVRLESSQPGGKLARYAGTGRTKIESRGDNHQVLAPGCPAECHEKKALYEWTVPIKEELPVLEDVIWLELCRYAAECNEYAPVEQPRDYEPATGNPSRDGSPGQDFNLRGTWDETGLFEAGWRWCKRCGQDQGFLTRPGKERGISASVGMVSSKKNGFPYFFPWTTSNTDFVGDTPYSRFAVYAILKHGGNFSEAAKALYREGYGERRQAATYEGVDLSEFNPGAQPTQEGPLPEDRKRIFKWMSELGTQSEEAQWIWQGYLARGGITLMSALWKSGKSTLLSHLLKSLDGAHDQFLGLPVAPGSRVLYCTEEHESIWSTRRDDLLIGDHVGMISRPFVTRPTTQQWHQLLAQIGEQVQQYRFDLVVFDTLSKMWPVREENDAGQVEEALMPLWKLSQQGISVLLVHHTRKSGGDHFVSSRGSGGLSAFCEILMDFGAVSNNLKDSKRLIKARGRYQQTPVEWLIELTPSGYVGHGDPEEHEGHKDHPSREEYPWEKEFQEVMQQTEVAGAMTINQISDAIAELRGTDGKPGPGPKKVHLLNKLRKLAEEGEIAQFGQGTKGDPFEYKLP